MEGNVQYIETESEADNPRGEKGMSKETLAGQFEKEWRKEPEERRRSQRN